MHKVFFGGKNVEVICSCCKRHGLAVPRAGDRSYVTGSIHGWSRSHLTYITGGCLLEERKLTLQSPSITVEFSVQYNLKITLYKKLPPKHFLLAADLIGKRKGELFSARGVMHLKLNVIKMRKSLKSTEYLTFFRLNIDLNQARMKATKDQG